MEGESADSGPRSKEGETAEVQGTTHAYSADRNRRVESTEVVAVAGICTLHGETSKEDASTYSATPHHLRASRYAKDPFLLPCGP
jgi:hypothetical protein